MTLKNILEERGLEHIESAELDRLFDAANSIIHGRLQLRILGALSTDDKEHFFSLLDRKGHDEEIDAFLKQKFPDLCDAIATVISEYKEEVAEQMRILNAL